ncbi:MAG: diguanylate cyclase [Phycisphaerales bacterium]|nr:diguanylate cyclase [Phycisphaerales bacterium]
MSETQKILIVDDDPIMIRLLEKHLVSAGYSLLKASNGADALQLVTDKGPSLVITDWEMPQMNGIELCRAVRSAEGVGLTYLIILTSHSDKKRVVEAFEAGADDYVAKPFDRGELLARVKAGMRVVEAEADLARRNLEIHKINAELAILNDKLEQIATTDELTGLANRRQAMDRLTEYWETSQRYQQPIACIMIDLDHFKQVNDTYGHDAGDVVLRQMGQLLTRYTRLGDLACRLGGEEFLVLCPHSTVEAGRIVAERLRQNVESVPITIGGKQLKITISLGVAQRTADICSKDDLLKSADRALYQAKHEGRNRVCVSNPDGCRHLVDSMVSGVVRAVATTQTD